MARRSKKTTPPKKPIRNVIVLTQPHYANSNGKNLPADPGQSLLEVITKRNEGRASQYDPVIAANILEAIAEGSTVEAACKKAGICRTTHYTWRALIPDYANEVKRAHELQADSMVDDNVQMLENVDVTSEESDPRRLMAALRKAEQVARFKFDLAKCLNFQQYGDKKAQLNVNANVDIKEGDASKWFNR